LLILIPKTYSWYWQCCTNIVRLRQNGWYFWYCWFWYQKPIADTMLHKHGHRHDMTHGNTSNSEKYIKNRSIVQYIFLTRVRHVTAPHLKCLSYIACYLAYWHWDSKTFFKTHDIFWSILQKVTNIFWHPRSKLQYQVVPDSLTRHIWKEMRFRLLIGKS